MKIALYGKQFNDDFDPYFQKIIKILYSKKAEIIIHKPFYEILKNELKECFSEISFFTNATELKKNAISGECNIRT